MQERHQELICILNENNRQMGKMNDEKTQLKTFFEDHDFDQLKVIKNKEKEINNLKQKILKLKSSKLIRYEEKTCPDDNHIEVKTMLKNTALKFQNLTIFIDLIAY